MDTGSRTGLIVAVALVASFIAGGIAVGVTTAVLGSAGDFAPPWHHGHGYYESYEQAHPCELYGDEERLGPRGGLLDRDEDDRPYWREMPRRR